MDRERARRLSEAESIESAASLELDEGTLQALRLVLDESPTAAIVASLEGRIAYVNPVMREQTGHHPGEMVGREVWMLHPAVDAVDKQIWEAVSTGRSWSGRMWGRTKDGAIRWVHADVSPLRDSDGSIAYCLVLCQPLSAPRPATQRSSQAQAVDAGPEFVFVTDLDGIIQFVNGTVAGLGQDEVVGAPVYGFLPPDQHDIFREHMTALIVTGESRRFEVTAVGPNGFESRYETLAMPILHEGSVVAICCRSRDITTGGEREPSVEGGARELIRQIHPPQPRRASAARTTSRPRAPRRRALSNRELQVLRMLSAGLTNREAAERLELSTRTVDHHVSSILAKLRASNRTAAVVSARRRGLLTRRSRHGDG